MSWASFCRLYISLETFFAIRTYCLPWQRYRGSRHLCLCKWPISCRKISFSLRKEMYLLFYNTWNPKGKLALYPLNHPVFAYNQFSVTLHRIKIGYDWLISPLTGHPRQLLTRTYKEQNCIFFIATETTENFHSFALIICKHNCDWRLHTLLSIISLDYILNQLSDQFIFFWVQSSHLVHISHVHSMSSPNIQYFIFNYLWLYPKTCCWSPSLWVALLQDQRTLVISALQCVLLTLLLMVFAKFMSMSPISSSWFHLVPKANVILEIDTKVIDIGGATPLRKDVEHI